MRRYEILSYVVIGLVEALEPIVITGKYGRGAFYRALDYIPSSTLSGAIVFKLRSSEKLPENLSELKESLTRNTIWLSNAYPIVDEVSLGIFDPLPLPLTTLALKDGRYVSSALIAAEVKKKRDLDVVKVLYELNPKVGRVFAYVEGNCVKIVSPYPKKVYTRVCLDLKTRTVFMSERNTGLLYTIEYVDVEEKPPRFIFRGVVDGEVLDFLKGGLELKVGSRRAQGYGLIRLSIRESMELDKYLRERSLIIGKTLANGYLTVDVVTYLRNERSLEKLGRILYQRVRRDHVKKWLLNAFILYRNVVYPGGVYVLEPNVGSDELARLEVKPPDDPIVRLHGLDMLFFNNPIHFIQI